MLSAIRQDLSKDHGDFTWLDLAGIERFLSDMPTGFKLRELANPDKAISTMVELAIGQYIRDKTGLLFSYEGFKNECGRPADFYFQKERVLMDAHLISTGKVAKEQSRLDEKVTRIIKAAGLRFVGSEVVKITGIETSQDWSLSISGRLSDTFVKTIEETIDARLQEAAAHGLDKGTVISFKDRNDSLVAVNLKYKGANREHGFHVFLSSRGTTTPASGFRARAEARGASKESVDASKRILMPGEPESGPAWLFAQVGEEYEEGPIDRVHRVLDEKIPQIYEPGFAGVVALAAIPTVTGFHPDWPVLLNEVFRGNVLAAIPRNSNEKASLVPVQGTELSATRDDVWKVSALFGVSMSTSFEIEEFHICRNMDAKVTLPESFRCCEMMRKKKH